MLATDLFGTEAPGGVIPANTSHFFLRWREGVGAPFTHYR